MRPYRGLGAINTTWGKNWNGYDSIQMSLNRRFRDGVQATLNYTRSLRTIGNCAGSARCSANGIDRSLSAITHSSGNSTAVFLDDNAGGTITFANTDDRAHTVTASDGSPVASTPSRAPTRTACRSSTSPVP